MIPKIIHCCWLSGAPKTELAKKCLASWKKYAPDWEIREWNLSCLSSPPSFFRSAVTAKKWAFAADWVRFAALREHGGVYFDFDFELVKPIAELPAGEWCAGQRMPSGRVGLEPAAIALEKDSPIARAMLAYYDQAEFGDKLTVGEILGELAESSQCRIAGLKVLAPEVMSPIGLDGKLNRTEKTVGIHWYAMSWASPRQRILQWMNWHGFGWVVRGLVGLKHALMPLATDWIAADFWEEHCTECGAPDCYRECPMFERSEIGRCRRLEGGLVKMSASNGGDAFAVTFRPWGKLEMIFHGRLTTRRRFVVLRAIDAVAAPVFRLLTRLTPRQFPYWRNPWGLYRSLRWRLVRVLSGKSDSPLRWSIRASAARPVNLVASVATKENVEICRYRLAVGTASETHVFNLPSVATGDALYRIFAANEADCGVAVRLHRLELTAAGGAEALRGSFVKCLAWDLDGTLWKGTLSEDGVAALVLNEDAVRLVRALDRRGIVNSIVSRNDFASAIAALKAFGIEDLFVFPQINWGPKSEGLRRLSREMNVGLDAIAFVDDREENLNEVRANAVSVRVFASEDIPVLASRPEFNPPVSSESAMRRIRYREEMVRRGAAAVFDGDASAFLAASEIREEILPVAGEAVVRCRELVQRTNQLNLTGRRYDEAGFAKLLAEADCKAIRVVDRYGDYGIVGFVAVRGTRVVECCFSCRVAEKGVERRVLERLAAGRKMTADVVVTPKNEKIRRIVEEWLRC